MSSKHSDGEVMSEMERLHWKSDMLIHTLLDLIVEACKYGDEDPQSIRLMAISEKENGYWYLDSLATLQAASFVSMFFNMNAKKATEDLYAKPNLREWACVVANHLNRFKKLDITFLTSGSTGKAKKISHSLSDLVHEARLWIELNGEVRFVYSMVATNHIYGFVWATLLPALCGASVVDARKMPLSTIKENEKSLVVTIPDCLPMLQLISHDIVSHCNVVVSGSPCHHNKLVYAVDLGVKRAIQIYGSTETGGVAWRDQNRAAYTLRDDLEVDGDSVLYRGKKLDIQDHLSFVDSRSFNVLGRKDGVIQIKGRNVDVSVIRQKIADHCGIADSALKVKDLGDQKHIHLFIVPGKGELEDKLRDEIVTICNESVLAQNIVFGQQVPKNEMGKVADWSTF